MTNKKGEKLVLDAISVFFFIIIFVLLMFIAGKINPSGANDITGNVQQQKVEPLLLSLMNYPVVQDGTNNLVPEGTTFSEFISQVGNYYESDCSFDSNYFSITNSVTCFNNYFPQWKSCGINDSIYRNIFVDTLASFFYESVKQNMSFNLTNRDNFKEKIDWLNLYVTVVKNSSMSYQNEILTFCSQKNAKYVKKCNYGNTGHISRFLTKSEGVFTVAAAEIPTVSEELNSTIKLILCYVEE